MPHSYTRVLLLAAASVLFALPARAAGSYGIVAAGTAGQPVVVGADVEYLDSAVDDLQDAVKGVAYSDNDVHARAAALFQRIVRADTTDTGAVQLRGWAKPNIHTAAFRAKNGEEDITVGGMSQSVYSTLMAAEVPPPDEIMEAYVYGEGMEARGLKNYDDGRVLGDGQLGVYMYKKREAIAIYFHKMIKSVQGWVGNEFAAATDLHESAHSRDHSRGQLNPVEVRKGEVLAYKTEYLWLNLMDPTGQKLSWARATFGKFSQGANKAPDFVAEYLEHLAMIRDYGNRDDFYGLVAKLGYQDRHNHASSPNGHEEPGRPDHDPNHDGHDPQGHDGGDRDEGNSERPGEERG